MEDDGHITVEFKTKTSTFQYPQAFELFIKAEDPGVQEEALNKLQAIKDAQEAEKAAKAEAARVASEAEKAAKAGAYSEKKYKPVRRKSGHNAAYLAR